MTRDSNSTTSSAFSGCSVASLATLVYIPVLLSYLISYSVLDPLSSPDLLLSFISTFLIASLTPSIKLSSPVGIHIPPPEGVLSFSDFSLSSLALSDLDFLSRDLDLDLDPRLLLDLLSLDLDLDLLDFISFDLL